MSDVGRQNFATNGKDDLTPNSMKSTQQKLRDSTANDADRLARGEGDSPKSSQSNPVRTQANPGSSVRPVSGRT